MIAERCLIVNADDFGRSPGINRGIIRAHENGIVTSASLMVRWPTATEAAEYAAARPALSVGLHVDLGEWTFQDSEWLQVYEVVPLQDRDAVAREVAQQLEGFRRLLGRPPTHLDSHQHVHRDEPVRSILHQMAKNLQVPLRHNDASIRYCGQFYGQNNTGSPNPQAIGVEFLLEILRDLPRGATELGCHPGEVDDLSAMYRDERPREIETLCDPRVREFLDVHGIRLRSFHSMQSP